jgi:predicted TIM-barrel fold metal-dependent hydrolase
MTKIYRMNLTAPNFFVDTHFHVFAAGQAITGARYVPAYSARVEDWMAQAQPLGVTHGVLVQPSFLGADNTLLVQTLQAHPGVLRGVAVVEPSTGRDALNLLHAAGVRGVRLNLAGVSHALTDWSAADALWEGMLALGWHLEVHTDRGGLPGVLAQLPPQLPLVVDHMAKPERAHVQDPTVAALVRHAKHTPTYIKLSGAYRLSGVDPVQLARLWLGELGVAALLWGSDWPCTNHEALAQYSELFSSLEDWVGAAHREQVLSANARRLYWSV